MTTPRALLSPGSAACLGAALILAHAACGTDGATSADATSADATSADPTSADATSADATSADPSSVDVTSTDTASTDASPTSADANPTSAGDAADSTETVVASERFRFTTAGDVALGGVVVRFEDAAGRVTERALDSDGMVALDDFATPLSATLVLAPAGVVHGFYGFAVADLDRARVEDVVVVHLDGDLAPLDTVLVGCSATLTSAHQLSLYVNHPGRTGPESALMSSQHLVEGSGVARYGSIAVPAEGPVHVVGMQSVASEWEDAPRIEAWTTATFASAASMQAGIALDFATAPVTPRTAAVSVTAPAFAERDSFWILGSVAADWDGVLLVGRSDGLVRGAQWAFSFEWIEPESLSGTLTHEIILLGDVVSSILDIDGPPVSGVTFTLGDPIDILDAPATFADLDAEGLRFNGRNVDATLRVTVDGAFAAQIQGGRGIGHFAMPVRPGGAPLVSPLASQATLRVDGRERGDVAGTGFTRRTHGWPVTIAR